MNFLNPFKKPEFEQLKQIIHNRIIAKNAEKRLSNLLRQYREILKNTEYQGIRKDLDQILGEQIERLVECASTCSKCSPLANRIKILTEVVDQPYQAVWNANHIEKLEQMVEEREAAESGNGDYDRG